LAGHCRITWPQHGKSIKGLKIGVPTAFYVDDLDPEVARVLDETNGCPQA